MKIKKNRKVIRLTESDLKRIVKRVLTEEQRDDIPKDVKMVYDKYLMSPEIEDYIFNDNFEDAKLMWEKNEYNHVEELIETLAHGFTFMAATGYIYGEGFDDDYELEGEMSDKLLKYYDHEQIIRQVLENINHPKKEEVYAFIDQILPREQEDITRDSSMLSRRRRGMNLSGNELYRYILDKYINPVMDEHDMDEFGDEFEYYDNVIGWGIENYLESEEPEREDDWDYRDELENEIKDWWQPI